jgi:hypothetical protein
MKYTPVTLPEFEEVLKAEKGWQKIESTKETIFVFPLTSRPHIVIKVYYSIGMNHKTCREKGADAIRVCAVNTEKNIGWIKTRKVLRVEGWRNNLQNAVMDIYTKAKKRIN